MKEKIECYFCGKDIFTSNKDNYFFKVSSIVKSYCCPNCKKKGYIKILSFMFKRWMIENNSINWTDLTDSQKEKTMKRLHKKDVKELNDFIDKIRRNKNERNKAP